jgi:metallo-beta-lactamase class B
VQIAGFVLVLLLAAQTPTFNWDSPHQCDDCAAWNKPRAPFKLYGNTYYVGTDGLSSILIAGDAGHILLDGGLEQSAPLIDANIRTLGFKTQDVKLIVNSHGHFDHAGGIAALQRLTGAAVAVSASGAAALGKGINTPDDPQAGFPKAFNAFPPVKNIRVIKDGEVQRVGPLAITPHFTPGHAPGSTTWTWQSCQPSRPEGQKCLNMVYADSLSAVSAPGFKFTAQPALIAKLRKSITLVGELPCDVMVSTHPGFTQIDAKLKRRAEMKATETDPFIDPQLCRAYAANAMKGLEARLAEEKK